MPGVKLFGPGGLFGPEIIPNPEFHAPPRPEEHAYGPPSIRTTDEWGVVIRGGPGRQDNGASIRAIDVLEMEAACHKKPIAPPLKPLTTAEEIKLLATTLTYGEMMELVAEIWRHSPEKSLTADTAPAVLWTWATYVYPDPPA